jgi:hypothetical protein
MAHGQYAISASGGSVSFQGAVSLGSPIQISTRLTSGTTISSSQPFTIEWTGGDAGTFVKVSLGNGNVVDEYTYEYADAASGSLTLSPICEGNPVSAGGNGVVCSFGIPYSTNAQVVVEVLPAASAVSFVTADGITQSVQMSWTYRYVFGGLILQH